MNKYQKSLNWLEEECRSIKQGESKRRIDVLQELVEKKTPKFIKCPKGWQGTRYTRYYCPSCNKTLELAEYPFCKRCGQALKYPKTRVEDNKHVLDWSDE